MASAVDQIKELIGNISGGGSIVGLDIGISAIKVCEMSAGKKGKFKLEKFAAIPLTEAAIIEDEIQKPEEVEEAIDKAIHESGIKSKTFCLGISGVNTMTKRMQVPDGTKEEIEDHILWEAEQYIPFGADDSELDFAIVGELEDGVKDTLVAAARSDVIESYQTMIKEAGYNVRIVDLNVFALSNCFEAAKLKNLDDYNQGTILIDFGAQKTTVIIYKNGGPVLTKEVNLGGVLITEEIQRQMGVSYEEAEDLKIYGDADGNLPEEIVGVIEEKLENLLSELKKVLNFYIAAGSSEQAQYCFITGGSSRLPGLKESLQNVVDMEVEFFDPFEGIEYNKKKFSEDELEQISATGVVCMGLGMRIK